MLLALLQTAYACSCSPRPAHAVPAIVDSLFVYASALVVIAVGRRVLA